MPTLCRLLGHGRRLALTLILDGVSSTVGGQLGLEGCTRGLGVGKGGQELAAFGLRGSGRVR